MKPYTGRAYLFIEDDEIVGNVNKYPQKDDYRLPTTGPMSVSADDHRANRLWKEDIAKWETQHFRVENAEAWDDKNTITIYHLEEHRGDQDHTELCNVGQPCHIENGIVVKLLT